MSNPILYKKVLLLPLLIFTIILNYSLPITNQMIEETTFVAILYILSLLLYSVFLIGGGIVILNLSKPDKEQELPVSVSFVSILTLLVLSILTQVVYKVM